MQIYANEMHDETMTFFANEYRYRVSIFELFDRLFKKQTSLELFTTTFISTERAIEDKFIDTKIIARSHTLWYL